MEELRWSLRLVLKLSILSRIFLRFDSRESDVSFSSREHIVILWKEDVWESNMEDIILFRLWNSCTVVLCSLLAMWRAFSTTWSGIGGVIGQCDVKILLLQTEIWQLFPVKLEQIENGEESKKKKKNEILKLTPPRKWRSKIPTPPLPYVLIKSLLLLPNSKQESNSEHANSGGGERCQQLTTQCQPSYQNQTKM